MIYGVDAIRHCIAPHSTDDTGSASGSVLPVPAIGSNAPFRAIPNAPNSG